MDSFEERLLFEIRMSFMKTRLFALMRKYDIHPKKYMSQNFIISKSVIERMASYAEGTVIEIGAGLGFITERLAQKAKKVYAYEKDRRLAEIFEKEHDFPNVEVLCEDFLLSSIPRFDTVVSNIPYRYSSDITFKLLQYPFRHAVLSYQKEFAERLCEEKGSRLAVMAEVSSRREYLQTVPKRCFYPQAETDSALVRIVPERKFETDAFFEDVVRALFSHKNQTVRNALIKSRNLFGKDKEGMKLLSGQLSSAKKKVFVLDIYEVKSIVDDLGNVLAV